MSMEAKKNNNYYNKMPYTGFMFICLLIVCVLIAVYLLFDYNSKFRFSRDSGFYDDSFELKIYGNKGYDIYYTLDCTAPTLESNKYDGPIKISDRTSEPNVYANREDISTGFLKKEINSFSSSSSDPCYVVPDYNVDKCTIVHAAIFDDKGQCVDEIAAVYFVGTDIKEKYDDIMVVSVDVEPYDLFDYWDGIYVTGAEYDIYKEESDAAGHNRFWWSSYWYMWPANYRQKGREFEKEAQLEIFDNKHNKVLAQKCGVRVQGDGSRGKLPRNLKLISREEYSGSRIFQTDLFNSGVDQHKYVLFGGGDDNIFKIKDYLANTMESELNFATMKFEPCVLFLEGEYWGTYYITEDYNGDYIQNYYNVPRDEVVIWKEDAIEEGNEEDIELYNDMVSFISQHDMSIDANYKKACEMIDIDSFADYFSSQIYIGRCGDWPRGNIAAWRSRDINLNSEYQDGKWRWMLFDANSEEQGLDAYVSEFDVIEYAINTSEVFASLIQNESFKELFCERLLYMENNIYTEDNINNFIDCYYEQMLEPLCESNMRFYGNERRDEIIENAENIRKFLLERPTYVHKMIVEHFGEEYLELGVDNK